MTPESPLLHPDYFVEPFNPLQPLDFKMRRAFEGQVHEAIYQLNTDPDWMSQPKPDLTVAIQSYEDRPEPTRRFFEELEPQIETYPGEVQVLLLAAKDHTTHATKKIATYHDAEIVDVPVSRDFRADILNTGLDVAEHELVISTVAHAALSHGKWLELMAHEGSKEGVAGAYGVALLDKGASLTERVGAPLLGANEIIKSGRTEISSTKNANLKNSMGMLAADQSVVRCDIASDLGGYNPRYGAGGADGWLGGVMIDKGFTVVRHPALGVHHTHGLNVLQTAKQYAAWKRMAEPHNYSDRGIIRLPYGGL